jgi:hypothetical protein
MTAAERERYQRRYGFLPKKDLAMTTETQTPRERGRIKLINTERRFLFINGDNGVDVSRVDTVENRPESCQRAD